MQIKDGVRFASDELAMMHASMVAQEVAREGGFPFVLTGGCEDRRHDNPHFYGRALDYRANHVNFDLAKRYERMVRNRLGDGFDVVLHGQGANLHLHVEYDPKD